jgi:hypothetical protein
MMAGLLKRNAFTFGREKRYYNIFPKDFGKGRGFGFNGILKLEMVWLNRNI